MDTKDTEPTEIDGMIEDLSTRVAEMEAATAKQMRQMDLVANYVMLPLGFAILGFMAYSLVRDIEQHRAWIVFDLAVGFLMGRAEYKLITHMQRRRWLKTHEHDYRQIEIYEHAEIDEKDAIRHTAFHVMGCIGCKQTYVFPLSNALMVTDRYKRYVRRDLKKRGWEPPPLW